MLVSPCRIRHLTQGGELSIMTAKMSDRSFSEYLLINGDAMDDPQHTDTLRNRRQRRIDRRRHEIIDAAVKIIAEQGYANATTKAIADAADMAEGTLYNYFKSKRDILLGILQQFQREADELLDEIESLEEAVDPVAIVECALDLLLTRLPFTRVLLAESWRDDDLLREYATGRVMVVYRRIKSFLMGQMKSGAFRSVDPDLATKMVLGVCLAPVLPAMRGVAEPPSAEELHAMAVAAVDLMMHGLEA
jgi:AcrR family transcriptional regulator